MDEKVIFVVDDDVYIGDMIEELLNKNGYGVLRAFSGSEAALLLKDKKPDLILLDLMLPGKSGEELLQEIKDIPVIVVSAKAAVSDKVELLTAGAADYITKPFDTRELLARIKARLRENVPDKCKNTGDIETDEDGFTARVCGKPVKLTRTEYAILSVLKRANGRVVSKNNIMADIETLTPDCEESSLRTHVGNLRNKLRAAGGKDYIEAVWGIGYKLKS